jgi:hypothetical protein
MGQGATKNVPQLIRTKPQIVEIAFLVRAHSSFFVFTHASFTLSPSLRDPPFLRAFPPESHSRNSIGPFAAG